MLETHSSGRCSSPSTGLCVLTAFPSTSINTLVSTRSVRLVLRRKSTTATCSPFGAAAAIGGLGGLAQIVNNGSVFTPSTEIRNGISEQSAAEGEQVLNHFLNRLPIITLKEGSRARIYIGRDILIPSYAEHRVDPTL